MIKQVKSVETNAILNVCRNVLSILFPLVTYPYVSRVLQVSNLGKVNYSISLVSYFALISALGIYTYAVRECSKRINHQKELQTFVSQIFSFNCISMCAAYLLLLLTLLFVKPLQNYRLLILIQSGSIFFTTMGIEWLNIAVEDYVYITVRSVIVQLFLLAALFLFVRSINDYYIYSIIMVVGNGLIAMLNIFHVNKYCRIRLTKNIQFTTHLKPVLILFSNNLAVSIYLNSDITILGWIAGDVYVGLYSVSVKVYGIIKQIIASFYFVILSRMSFYYQNERYDDFKELLNQTLNVIILLSVPASFGLYLVSEDVISVLFGAEYIEAVPTLKILSIAFLFAVTGGALAYCVNIPLTREKNNLIATAIGAIVNIVLNIFIIPQFKHVGAAFTTLVAEFIVSVILLIGLRDHIDFFEKKKLLETFVKSLISSYPMIGLYMIIKQSLNINGLGYLIPMVVLSIASYVLLNLIIKNEEFISFLGRIKHKSTKTWIR